MHNILDGGMSNELLEKGKTIYGYFKKKLYNEKFTIL